MVQRSIEIYNAATLAERLASDELRPIGELTKGFTMAGHLNAHQLIGKNIFESLTAPFAVIRESRLALNIVQFAAYTEAQGFKLSPHVKTTMSPQIFARQLWGGAWALTAATVAQVAAYRHYGVRRILLANQVVDASAIDYLAAQVHADPQFNLYVWVDSVAGVDLLAAQWQRNQPLRKLNVLIEWGVPNGRTGVRSHDEGLAVAQRVADSESLRIAGVAGFEGTAAGDAAEESLATVRKYCCDLRAFARSVAAVPGRSGKMVVSAGGSLFFDIVADELNPTALAAEDPDTSYLSVLRSGSYVTHDDGHVDELSPYRRRVGPNFLPAFEIWAHVLSTPQPGRAMIGAGKRDLAYDMDLPVITGIRGRDGTRNRQRHVTVTELNDQHAFVTFPHSESLAVGDMVSFGISHPCTGFDKWRALALADDADRITGVAYTYF